jgi:hypothetical protein
MIGTARLIGQGLGCRKPLTGATAEKSVESSHASWLTSRAPPEKPVAYTANELTQYMCSKTPTSEERNFTSLADPAGTARPRQENARYVPVKARPSGIRASGKATMKFLVGRLVHVGEYVLFGGRAAMP